MDFLDYLFLLELALIILKVSGYLTCSWIWIFVPIWLPVVFGVCLVIVYILLES